MKDWKKRYLFLAVLVFVLAGALLAGLWQLPHLFPQLASPTATAAPIPATPAPALPHPAIRDLRAEVDDQTQTITFRMAAEAPVGRQITEALLWYDTQAGHLVRHFAGPLPASTALTYTLDAVQEGLTTTLTTTGEIDYWWLVRDTAGESARAGGTAVLGPALQASIMAPTPEPFPVDFTWAVSRSQHFDFYYAPGSEAERDLPLIAAMARAGLAYITPTMEIESDDKLTIYLTPRVFWQGGAAYGKTNLISYLDRNYTAVEMWTYFTHEGAHALAQDLLQSKENGGPDSVLVEGLAVWATGGHYRPEPIDALAAIIADSDSYIPLAKLRAGPFYDFQHEISYMEAASFDKFLIERYGLDTFKQLYGQATGKPEQDEPLVERLYGKSYAALEEEWLDYLRSLSPTPQEEQTWQFKVRSFDLMRRYQTELDPNARTLPNAPTEWTSDTLRIFLSRTDAPANLVLETALIAAQGRADRGDMEGAAMLLDDVGAALDAQGELTRPSLQAGRAILDLLATQDRAILRADRSAYQATLDRGSAPALQARIEETIGLPLTHYWQELVRLDVADDGRSAEGVVLVHGRLAGGDFAGDGRLLLAVRFVRDSTASPVPGDGGHWLLSGCEPAEMEIIMPPNPGSS